MKIIHCSDLHLDSKMKSNLDSKKAKERRDEILITYQKMIDFAKENDVRIIMISGDMFDSKNVTVKAKNIVLDSIMSNPQIDFIYLKGNHDEFVFNEGLDNIPKNLKLFNPNRWITYKYENLSISGIEFGFLENYEIYNTLILNKRDINIVMMHGQETKYEQKDKTEVINIQALKNKNIDYLALGHIHKYKQDRIDNRGIYCYSGCLEGRGFDECGEKGFVLLDVNLEKNEITSEFIPIAGRHLYEINVDISNAISNFEVEEEINKAIKDIDTKEILKIVLKGKVPIDSERDLRYLEKKYNGMYYFVKIYDETVLDIDYMTYENDASLKGEFIRLVLKQELTEEEKKEIITTGIKALSGEELI